VFLELTFLRLAWTFNFDFAHYEMAGVIWCLGWCMILMAAMVKMSVHVVGLIGIAIVAGHNMMDSSFGSLAGSLGDDTMSALWKILYVGFWAGPISFGPDGPNLVVLYSIVPWIGVMAAGYAFGKILSREPVKRDRLCLGIGLGAIVLFLVLRGLNLYGDPNPWSAPADEPDGGIPALLSFLNTSKYPASFLFLLMTLGPVIAIMPFLERLHGRLAGEIATIGRVPFFFYVCHIPLIHALALMVSYQTLGQVSWWLFENHPMGAPPAPAEYIWTLSTLYFVWAWAIAMLYFACRWFADLKSRRTDWWLKYL